MPATAASAPRPIHRCRSSNIGEVRSDVIPRRLHPAGFVAAAAVLWIFLPLSNPQPPATRRIALSATQYEYRPGRLEVNQGDEIIFTLTSTDVVHGFYLDGYGIRQRIEPGITREIRFTVDRPGKFRYRCSVSCGPLHPFMIGELVVNANVPFWRATGLIVTLLAAFLLYLQQRGHSYGQEQTSIAS